MAKQGGPFIFERTYGVASFYRRGDVGLVRLKSNLTRERWETDAAFAGSRKSAGLLGKASRLASPFYAQIAKADRQYLYFRALTGLANELLHAGFNTIQIEKVLTLALERLQQRIVRERLAAVPQEEVPAPVAIRTQVKQTIARSEPGVDVSAFPMNNPELSAVLLEFREKRVLQRQQHSRAPTTDA